MNRIPARHPDRIFARWRHRSRRRQISPARPTSRPAACSWRDPIAEWRKMSPVPPAGFSTSLDASRILRPGLDRNLASNLDDLIGRQAEEVADMDGVALHHGEQPLLPLRQAQAVFAADHRFMTDIIRHIVEIDRTPQRFTGGEQFRNMGPLHEAETRFRAPEILRDF